MSFKRRADSDDSQSEEKDDQIEEEQKCDDCKSPLDHSHIFIMYDTVTMIEQATICQKCREEFTGETNWRDPKYIDDQELADLYD